MWLSARMSASRMGGCEFDFNNSTCPDEFKHARVVPLYKKGDYNSKFKKTGQSHFFTEYKMYRNQSQRAVKKGKSDLFKNQIEENQGNGKKLWDTLKQLGLPNKKQSTHRLFQTNSINSSLQ